MPLGLGLGLGIGKGNIYPPVSAFPTVADIPPGALVLDSDGVVKEYSWVVELNGPDFLFVQTSYTTINVANQKIQVALRDVFAGVSSLSQFVYMRNADRTAFITMYQTALAGVVRAQILNANGTTFGTVVGPSINTADGDYHEVALLFINSVAYIEVDNVRGVGLSVASWVQPVFSRIDFSDTSAENRPLQVCCIKQEISGSLVDWYKCDESSGAVLANQCDPTRPATLSDSTAHAEALVPVSLMT